MDFSEKAIIRQVELQIINNIPANVGEQIFGSREFYRLKHELNDILV